MTNEEKQIMLNAINLVYKKHAEACQNCFDEWMPGLPNSQKRIDWLEKRKYWLKLWAALATQLTDCFPPVPKLLTIDDIMIQGG